LSWEELIAKFKALASAVLPPAQCDEIVKLVREIDRTERIETLMHSLRQAR